VEMRDSVADPHYLAKRELGSALAARIPGHYMERPYQAAVWIPGAWTRDGRVGWPIEGTSTRTSLTGDLSAHVRAVMDPWAGAYPPARRRLARYKSGPLPVLGSSRDEASAHVQIVSASGPQRLRIFCRDFPTQPGAPPPGGRRPRRSHFAPRLRSLRTRPAAFLTKSC